MRAVAARMGLLLFSLALGAGIVEFAVRAALDVYRCDERMGWTFQRGRNGFKFNRAATTVESVRLNRHGFRGEDRPLEKPEGVHRTLILGDSFTAALHVAEEDSFASLLEAGLESKSAAGTSFEIVNAGVPGYSTAQELHLFREIGWQHEPDLVVLAVYLGNDIANNSIRAVPCHYLVKVCGRPFYDMRDGRLAALGDGKPMRVQPGGWADRLLGSSLVYRNLIHGMGEPVSEEAPEGQEVYGIESNTRGFPSWVTTMELVVQLQKAVEVYNIPFVVFIVSTQPEVVPAPATTAYRTLRKNFVAFLDHHGIAHIDSLAGLIESQEAGRAPYYETDHHWNEVGHAISAEAIQSYFIEHCDTLGVPIQGCEGERPSTGTRRLDPPLMRP